MEDFLDCLCGLSGDWNCMLRGLVCNGSDNVSIALGPAFVVMSSIFLVSCPASLIFYYKLFTNLRVMIMIMMMIITVLIIRMNHTIMRTIFMRQKIREIL